MASGPNSARLTEAQECERKAAECMKTSLLKMKFKPDFDGAAMHLERAAVCYKNADNLQKAVEILKTAAGYYEQLGNLFHAAKAREAAAIHLRDQKMPEEAFELFSRAMDGYAEAGSLDTAAMTVDKAGKAIAEQAPEKAIDIYKRGLALVQQSDRSKMASEFLQQITKLNMKLGRYDQAKKFVKEEIEKYVEVREYPRVRYLSLALTLLNLKNGDSVAATKDYGWIMSQDKDFEYCEECRICQQLIGYYEVPDDANFQATLKSGVIRSMDNEYLRLTRDLHAPAGGSGPGDENEDEDDFK
ncbi:hypothetical protein WR25_21780 [Diploscapter pachys]|uniref:Gamma-soluble NSF attachment protein n=1 Tax=Diploscapter pachys TaxID=2018661 RepID=A0A2A2LF84_9BILA|nr:hypothetical protein WR25_21780 [Diploscapter pachys]